MRNAEPLQNAAETRRENFHTQINMQPTIVILALAAAIWTVILMLRGSLLAGCLAYLIACSCLGTEFATVDAPGITLSLDRLFIIGLAATAVVQWRLGRFELSKFTRLDWLLVGFVGLLTVSTFTHDWQYDPRFGQHTVQHLINGYWIPLLLYLVARQAPIDERRSSLLLGGLCGFGIYLSLTAMAESAQAWSIVFPRYIADPEVGIHYGRARGPMVHSVSFGTYLAACMVAAWLWRDRLSRGWQAAVLLAMPLFPLAIYLTKTRSVWLGAATAVLVVVALTLRGRLRVALLTSMVAAGLLVGAMKMDSFMNLQREEGSAALTRHSTSMRPSFLYVSWLMFQDRPLMGFGFGQFASEKLPYLNDRTTSLQLNDIRSYVHHNTYLSILTETGLVGFSLFAALYIGWLCVGLQLVRDDRAPPWMKAHGVLLVSVIGIASWQMLAHDITFSPIDHGMIFLAAAIGIKLRQMLGADQIASDSRGAFRDRRNSGDWSRALNHG